MASLFDSLGPEWRAPDVIDAVRAMSIADATDRGAIFTRPEVVEAILDLSGYTADRPLHSFRFLEPAFGEGDFLLPAVTRLINATKRACIDSGSMLALLRPAIRAVELNQENCERTALHLMALLRANGFHESEARSLCEAWLVCDDFLLSDHTEEFDFVIGNPPYVRQERIPAALINEYRSRFTTFYDRADLYILFYERALDLLSKRGTLGFICANRWLKNKYGGPLRGKIARDFQLTHFIDMEDIDSFHADVIAYPAITIIGRQTSESGPRSATRIAAKTAHAGLELHELAAAMLRPEGNSEGVHEVLLDTLGDEPWLLDDLPRINLLRKIESRFPTIEQVGCKVGIGVATGCDRVFIDDFDALDVEPERKLPLVMARDLVNGQIHWKGKGVLNPFEANGDLADFSKYPRFAAHLEAHREAVSGRHVATRNADRWYRTIDRIYPELVAKPKLLIPDIKGESTVVLDEGHYYPHHNLYFVASDIWDLRALQTLLRSSVSILIIATYCTRMSGGFLRFQAQYLRRLRAPEWRNVPDPMRNALIAASTSRVQQEIDAPVFELFGLSEVESAAVTEYAHVAQVTAARRKLAQ